MSLNDLGPEILRILLLRWEGKLALDALFCFSLLEFDNEFTRGKPLPPAVPLTLVLIFELLELLERLLVYQLSESRFLHHFHWRQLIFV